VASDEWADYAAGMEEPLCSVARALDVVGTRSTMLMLREAFFGTRRFNDFARLVGVTDQVAAARLRALVEDGLLARVPYRDPGQRERHEYRLTDKGRDFYPVLVGLLRWGDEHATAPTGRPIDLVHAGCGAAVGVIVRCNAGHELVPRDVSVIAGPGLPAGLPSHPAARTPADVRRAT
jgi:DNA-binding HxlR family transcriptional regulator